MKTSDKIANEMLILTA